MNQKTRKVKPKATLIQRDHQQLYVGFKGQMSKCSWYIRNIQHCLEDDNYKPPAYCRQTLNWKKLPTHYCLKSTTERHCKMVLKQLTQVACSSYCDLHTYIKSTDGQQAINSLPLQTRGHIHSVSGPGVHDTVSLCCLIKCNQNISIVF